MNKRVVIIGGVAAGASCAARARRLSEQAEIILLERGEYISFANCGLPYHIGGEITDRSKLLVQTPEALKRRFRIDVRVNSEVIAINRERKTISVRHGGAEYDLSYDKLVIATGASPLKPPIPGIEQPGLFSLRDIPDMDRIISWIKERGAKSGVVVGGGYIGLEMAEQLHGLGLELTLIEALPQVVAPLDPEMAELLHRELGRNGVKLALGEKVTKFIPEASGIKVETDLGHTYLGDIVILGLGVRPEVLLAKQCGLELGARGGIKVDSSLRTSDSEIYAAGDVIEVTDQGTGESAVIPLAGPANRQGRIVADNIFGEKERHYQGTLGTAVLRLFELTAGCTGASEKTLKRVGRSYQALHLFPNHHASYYPGAAQLAIKLLFCPEDRKLLGGQVIGKAGVDKRVDVLATAIVGGLTVDDLANLELSYAPPFSSAKDPLNLAGMAAQNILDGLVKSITAAELAELRTAYLVVDVRSLAERERGAIPDSIHIPLDELRERMSELPIDKELIMSCQSGLRSYLACRILNQNGYRTRNLSGAYLAYGLYHGFKDRLQ